MLNISSIVSDKKLSILLPNTNKALAEVLSNASPKELESITQGKDLKSVLNSLLKDSSLNSAADKALLSLVKNNPTFKELSNVNQTIKELISTLKSDKNFEPIQKQIQKFLPDIKELNNSNLKTTFTNSGVFLESKLKDIQNPQVTLRSTLNELLKLVQKSSLPKARSLQDKINEILNSPTIKESSNEALTQTNKQPTKALQEIAKNVKNLFKELQAEIKNANPITSQKFAQKLEKLESLLQPKQITSSQEQVQAKQLEPEHIKLATAIEYNKNIKIDANKIGKNKLEVNLQKLEQLVQMQELSPENFKLATIMESIKDVNSILRTSFTNNSKGFMDALTKIFNALQNIEQNATTSKLAIEQILEKDIPKKITEIIIDIKNEIKSADPIYSKEVRNLTKELSLLDAPQKLSTQESIKEILSNDFKAVLHKVSEEITKLPPSANQNELLKQIDRLSLSIDYYQLASHLSSSSSLYLPVTWDEMQEGNISIKKASQDKFYCDIQLKLKEYKELNLRLTLYDENQLNIHISSDSAELKKMMGENMKELRSALIGSNITPRDIRFSNYTKNNQDQSYDHSNQNLNMGFEVKV